MPKCLPKITLVLTRGNRGAERLLLCLYGCLSSEKIFWSKTEFIYSTEQFHMCYSWYQTNNISGYLTDFFPLLIASDRDVGSRIWKGLQGFCGFTWGGDSQGEGCELWDIRDLGLTCPSCSPENKVKMEQLRLRWLVWGPCCVWEPGHWTWELSMWCYKQAQQQALSWWIFVHSGQPPTDAGLPRRAGFFQSHRGFVDRATGHWKSSHSVRYLGDPGEAAGFLEFKVSPLVSLLSISSDSCIRRTWKPDKL